MAATPHPDSAAFAINCAIVTVSDTRTVETDRSGQMIRQLLIDAGHQVVAYVILKDEPMQIQAELEQLSQRTDLAAVIINGGTGIAPRDTTYDAIAALLEKTLPGFGELFRWLSYQDIG
ncbi:MAG TPA: MogA/MoaB family molybdenum cofactor biosynthesis protein, partial [Crinalium sp.]